MIWNYYWNNEIEVIPCLNVKKKRLQFRCCDTVSQNLLMLKAWTSPAWGNEHPVMLTNTRISGDSGDIQHTLATISFLSDKLCDLITVWSLLEAGRHYLHKLKFFSYLYQQEFYWYFLLKNQAVSHTLILLCFCLKHFWTFNFFYWNNTKSCA